MVHVLYPFVWWIHLLHYQIQNILYPKVMRNAYNATDLYNLAVTKETRRWYNQELITKEQWETIRQAYPSQCYHPNFIIRILLFVATLIALSGLTGILALIFVDN